MSKATPTNATASDELPHDAAKIRDLLSSMGVTEYEPRVVTQLLDCVYRHVSDILQDAEAYRQRLGNSSVEIGMEDLLLAIQARETFTFVQPPPQAVIGELASKLNKQPLPDLSEKGGLQIPVNSLTGPVYQMTVAPEAMLPASSTIGRDENGAAQGGSTRRGGNRTRAQLEIRLNDQRHTEPEWMDTG